MTSLAARVVLLVSSYAPLLILFAALDSFGSTWASGALVATALISIAWLAVGIRWTRERASTDVIRTSNSRSRDAEVTSYFVSYVLPFAAAATPEGWRVQVSLLVFAVLLAALHLRAGVFFTHPLLLLVGFHTYEVTIDETPALVLTRRTFLRQREALRVAVLADGVYLEVSHDR